MASSSPLNPRIRQLIIKSSRTTHLQQVQSDERMYHSSESSSAISPTQIAGGSSRYPRRDSINIPQNAIHANFFQPSLVAGGMVDLSRTFTPTRHGTFSFGGKRKLNKTIIKSELSSDALPMKGQYIDKKSFSSPGSSTVKHRSASESWKLNSPIPVNTSEISHLTPAIELRLQTTEHRKASVPSPNAKEILDSSLQTQMIITIPFSVLSQVK